MLALTAQGIIPARAGNMMPRAEPRLALRDHPRSRGEYLRFIIFAIWGMGSSPLARGIFDKQINAFNHQGIIPARAGNIISGVGGVKVYRDHPRSRGEYRAGVSSRVILMGSSPLARGICTTPFQIPDRPGIIPARAGNICRGCKK